MKTLQSILSESILDKDGPIVPEYNKNQLAYTIYTSLEKLPKADKYDKNYDDETVYFYYDASVFKKFCRSIWDELNRVIKSDHLTSIRGHQLEKYKYPSGIAIHKHTGGILTIVAWNGNDTMEAQSEWVSDSHTSSQEKPCYTITCSHLVHPLDLKAGFGSWKLHNWGPWYFVPCPVDTSLMKALCDSKK